jgi:hypothetical protein
MPHEAKTTITGPLATSVTEDAAADAIVRPPEVTDAAAGAITVTAICHHL